ncbi:MAG TPA: HEAT repeat domain-containing protein [Armatimonadota bacterium]|nr:HEAT repeat domain-containing protein [Armatimonadota bacterium]
MNKSKWIWRGVIGLVVLYAVFAGVSRHMYMSGLARDLRFGSRSEKIKAAKELMKRDRLYDKVQEMPKAGRIEVMDAVEDIPGALTVKQCLLLLKDTEADVRARVAKALSLLGEHQIELLVPAMRDSDENVRNGAKDALVAIGPKIIPDVQRAAEEPELRGAALDVLVRIGEPSVPALIVLLSADDQDLRVAAADSLGKIGSKGATPALLKAADDIPAVRRVAISSLCTIRDPRSADLLVEVLNHTKDDGEVRARAAHALSVIGGPRAVAALTGALADWDLKVRTSVITGLQTMNASAVKPVTAVISRGSPEVRRAGAAVLEKIDSPEAVPALLQLARDGDPAVRASAARGLGAQTAGVGVDVLISLLADKDGRAADAALDSLVRLGSRGAVVIPSLASVLRSSASDVVKYRAADVLGRIGASAVDSLLAVLNTGGDAAKFAAYALGRTGDPDAKPALEKLAGARDPDLAWIAKRALAHM